MTISPCCCQQISASFLKPHFSLIAMVFRARAIAAGVIAVSKLGTLIIVTLKGMTAEIIGPAMFDIFHRPKVAGQHSLMIFFSVFFTIPTKDVG